MTTSTPTFRKGTKEDYYAFAPEPLSSYLGGATCSKLIRGYKWASDPNFAKTMPEYLNFYTPHACHLCKRCPQLQPHVTLFRCAACKIMKYCSREHQAKDWPSHKKWCKAFTKVMKAQEEEPKLPFPRGLSAQIGIDESLYVQVPLLQPSCVKCHRTGRELGKKLVVCPDCAGVAVCKDCIQTNTWKDFHDTKKDCETHLKILCIAGDMITLQGTHVRVSDLHHPACFQPKDWFEYLELQKGNFQKATMIPSFMTTNPQVHAQMTDGLSQPMTVHQVLSELSLQEKRTLCIHIVGAADTEFLFIKCWNELFRINPHLWELDLVMVGPNWSLAPEPWPLDDFLNDGETPLPSHLRGDIHSYAGLYHQVLPEIKKDGLADPDLVALFHPGISDPSYKSEWEPTLRLLQEQASPILVTGYNLQEVVDDHSILTNSKSSSLRTKIEPTGNPFRGLRPYLEPSKDDGAATVYYTNSCYFLLE